METLSEKQKITKLIVRIFCGSILWMGVGIVTLPVFFPLLALEKDISGSLTGMILCLPALTMIIMVPLIRRMTMHGGIELTICVAGVLFGLGFIIFSFSAKVNEQTPFVWMCSVANIVIGFAVASNTVGEQTLLLKYSDKKDRE
jgi:MFS family permease